MYRKCFKRFCNLWYERASLKGVSIFFSFDFSPFDANDILDIPKYLMKKTWYKMMFVLIMKTFIGLLTGLINGSNHTKYVLLSNQKCKIQLTLNRFTS